MDEDTDDDELICKINGMPLDDKKLHWNVIINLIIMLYIKKYVNKNLILKHMILIYYPKRTIKNARFKNRLFYKVSLL